MNNRNTFYSRTANPEFRGIYNALHEQFIASARANETLRRENARLNRALQQAEARDAERVERIYEHINTREVLRDRLLTSQRRELSRALIHSQRS